MSFQFESMQAFWAMGGYGFFVWLSFGLSIGVMALLLGHTLFVSKKIKQNVETDKARAMRILQARQARAKKRELAAQDASTESAGEHNS